MPSAAASNDPIRAEVERRLTQLADTLVVGPFTQLGRLVRLTFAPCRFVRTRLAEPFAVVRSITELAIGRRAGSGPEPAPVFVAASGGAPDDEHLIVSIAAPAADDLPITDYESLAASQVVARLDDLPADDLERVRAFESAHRGRRTVLGKVDHLLATR